MTVFEQASLTVTAVLTTATNLKISTQNSLGAFVWNCFFESFAQNCRSFRTMNCKRGKKNCLEEVPVHLHLCKIQANEMCYTLNIS